MIIYKEENLHKYNKEQKTYYVKYVDSGLITASKNWFHKQRFLDKYELIFVTEGELFFQIDDDSVTICENQVIIIPPFKTLKGTKISSQKTSFFWIDFMTDSPDIFEIILMKIHNIKSSLFRNIIENLTSFSNLSDCRNFVYDSYLLMLFNEIKNNIDVDSAKKLLALKVSGYIEENISRPITAESIADDLNYNKDYLCRIINHYYGTTLKEYINRQKINLSKKLLTTSNYSIKEIADFIGYDDSNLFTKFFKYHVKMSPLEFRKNN